MAVGVEGATSPQVLQPGEGGQFYADRVSAIVAAMASAQAREEQSEAAGDGGAAEVASGGVYRRKDRLRVAFWRAEFDPVYDGGNGCGVLGVGHALPFHPRGAILVAVCSTGSGLGCPA